MERWGPTVVAGVLAAWSVYASGRHLKKIDARLRLRPHPTARDVTWSARETQEADDEYIHVRVYDEVRLGALQDKHAVDLVDDKAVVHADENSSAWQVIEELKRIHGKVAFITKENRLVGILETLDIVRAALQPMDAQTCVRRMLRLCIVAEEMTPFVDILSYLRNGIRYIAVKTACGFRLMSQRVIVTRLMEDECDMLAHTIKELGLGRRRPLHVRETQCARDAFELMVAYGFTSLPIVSENGIAQSVISATDIFYAMQNETVALDQNVMDYLDVSRSAAGILRELRCIVSCTVDDSLDAVLKLMMRENVHHVYVLDDRKAIGVVSLVDVLKLL